MLLPRGVSKYGLAVWNDRMDGSVAHVPDGELVTAIKNEDEYGWVRVLTREGVSGIVHRTNLMFVPVFEKRN